MLLFHSIPHGVARAPHGRLDLAKSNLAPVEDARGQRRVYGRLAVQGRAAVPPAW